MSHAHAIPFTVNIIWPQTLRRSIQAIIIVHAKHFFLHSSAWTNQKLLEKFEMFAQQVAVWLRSNPPNLSIPSLSPLSTLEVTLTWTWHQLTHSRELELEPIASCQCNPNNVRLIDQALVCFWWNGWNSTAKPLRSMEHSKQIDQFHHLLFFFENKAGLSFLRKLNSLWSEHEWRRTVNGMKLFKWRHANTI